MPDLHRDPLFRTNMTQQRMTTAIRTSFSHGPLPTPSDYTSFERRERLELFSYKLMVPERRDQYQWTGRSLPVRPLQSILVTEPNPGPRYRRYR